MSHLSAPEDAEWRTRKLSVFGAARSFLGGLRIGQDVSTSPMPAIFFDPYSNHELIAARMAMFAALLERVPEQTDPLERILSLTAWFMTLTRKESMERKPFNPVLGETHVCSVQSERGGRHTFFAEQVSHNPPVMAFTMRCERALYELEGAIGFAVRFHGNSASVAPDGMTRVRFPPLKNDEEVYEIGPGMPQLSLKNLLLGSRRTVWAGDVTISCASTGYQVKLTYKDGGKDANSVSGEVLLRDTVLYTLRGMCGGETTIRVKGDKSAPLREIVDVSKLRPLTVEYLPPEKRSEWESLRVWAGVADAVIANDMETADAAKLQVETAQRKRRHDMAAANVPHEPVYFAFNEDAQRWDPKSDRPPPAYGEPHRVPTSLPADDAASSTASSSSSSTTATTIAAHDPPAKE